jgi:hypothetical protein
MSKNREYTRRIDGLMVYKWKPDANLTKTNLTVSKNVKYCDAKPFSQGFDFISTYSYMLSVINNEQVRIAYVACDYVQ